MVNLKKRRKQLGLTQKALAEAAGVDQQSIYQYEVGKYEPSISTIKALAKALDTSVDYLIGCTEESTGGSSNNVLNDHEFLALYNALTSESKSLLCQLANVLPKK